MPAPIVTNTLASKNHESLSYCGLARRLAELKSRTAGAEVSETVARPTCFGFVKLHFELAIA